MPAGMKEEEEVEVEADQEIVAEEETTEEEVVSEEETTEEEVVAEESEESEEVEVVAEYDVQEDIDALIAGEELSEEFQEKARTIFETAINTKVAEIKEQITAKYEEQLVEQVAEIKVELTERVDSYLEYVAQEVDRRKSTRS